MFKQILFSLWICGVSLAGATATNMPFWPGHDGAGESDAAGDAVSLVYNSTELLSALRLTEGQIGGYVLAEFAYGVEDGHGEGGPDPTLLIADAFNALVARGVLDIGEHGWTTDINEIASDIEETVNASAGTHAVWKVYVTQMDYLSSDDIGANSAARREAIRSE